MIGGPPETGDAAKGTRILNSPAIGPVPLSNPEETGRPESQVRAEPPGSHGKSSYI